jgi:hypothetical protein
MNLTMLVGLPEFCFCLLFFSSDSWDAGWPAAGDGTARLTGRTFLHKIIINIGNPTLSVCRWLTLFTGWQIWLKTGIFRRFSLFFIIQPRLEAIILRVELLHGMKRGAATLRWAGAQRHIYCVNEPKKRVCATHGCVARPKPVIKSESK